MEKVEIRKNYTIHDTWNTNEFICSILWLLKGFFLGKNYEEVRKAKFASFSSHMLMPGVLKSYIFFSLLDFRKILGVSRKIGQELGFD